ncbi:MAG TPA: metallophosphoesterase [Actinomycetota bacterium]|nr:metallophosphoesterase [Actinomycetota bacterium]
MADGTVRLYVVSDIHASEKAWRKMLNAARVRMYEADAVVYAGDLTGKAMVPVVETGRGFEAEVVGRRRVARTEEELARLEQEIANLGFYAMRTTPEEVERFRADPALLEERFHAEIRGRVAEWMRLAAERMEGTGVPIYLIPGNDDPYEIDDVLAESPYCVNVDGRVEEIPGGLRLLGSGRSNPTPWRTPREVPDDEFREQLAALAEEAGDPRRTVFLTHCPPHASGLDTAPLLDADLRPTVSAGDLLRGPVGSTGVRQAIEEFRPLLGLHGHIHESGGEARVGETLCLNPGSEAAFGILRGYLVDVGPDGVERAFRVEG